jgi:hypothetical protein
MNPITTADFETKMDAASEALRKAEEPGTNLKSNRLLASGWGRNVFGVVAFNLRAIPCLNLPRVVHFSEVECPSTGRTLSGRHTRYIKLAVAKIRIAVTITEDAITIAALALVERFCLSR